MPGLIVTVQQVMVEFRILVFDDLGEPKYKYFKIRVTDIDLIRGQLRVILVTQGRPLVNISDNSWYHILSLL